MSKGIFKAFVTPSFIHSADDDATVDVVRRKVMLLASQTCGSYRTSFLPFRTALSYVVVFAGSI
jgi:hypothetical protein